MIDEPLALLAEAFGQDLAHPISPAVGEKASDEPSESAVIAAAHVGRAETVAAVA